MCSCVCSSCVHPMCAPFGSPRRPWKSPKSVLRSCTDRIKMIILSYPSKKPSLVLPFPPPPPPSRFLHRLQTSITWSIIKLECFLRPFLTTRSHDKSAHTFKSSPVCNKYFFGNRIRIYSTSPTLTEYKYEYIQYHKNDRIQIRIYSVLQKLSNIFRIEYIRTKIFEYIRIPNNSIYIWRLSCARPSWIGQNW